jgi:hypothetical protein
VKHLLAIMCGIMVLSMGGCAVLLLTPQSSSNIDLGGPLVLLPIALLVLNLLVLGGLLGWKLRWRPAFYILGIIDLLVAAGMLFAIATAGSDPILRSMTVLFVMVAIVSALKGILTFICAKKLAGI